MIVIIIAVAVAAFFLLKNTSSDQMMSVNLYDSQGNLIKSSNQFSIVEGTSGVAQLDFTIKVQNTGNIPLSCKITTANPTELNSALSKTAFSVAVGQTYSLTSSKINANLFESRSQPVTFSATVECSYTAGTVTTLPTKTAQMTLEIKPDVTGGFNVEIDSGGSSGTTTVCGNGVCESPTETTSNCPADCKVTSKVLFRSTETSIVYGIGTSYAIAFATSCGGPLTKAVSDGGALVVVPSSCLNSLGGTYSLMYSTPSIKEIKISAGGTVLSATQNIGLYKTSSSSSQYVLCGSTASNQVAYVSFSTNPSTSLISDSISSINPTKEALC